MRGSTAAVSCVSSLPVSKEQEDDALGEETWKKSLKSKKENAGMSQQATRPMSLNMSSRKVAEGCLKDGEGTTEILKGENR